MKRINPNLFPRGGYIFIEKDGVTIVGGSWAGVAARLASYRTRKGEAPGNTLDEVMRQACERNPGYCTEDSEVTREQTKIVSLKGKILKWFSALRQQNAREPLQFVDTHTSLLRAGACITCPMNAALEEGCGSCKAAVEALRGQIIGGRSPHNSLLMHGCKVLGIDLATAVHLDEVTVENNELPGHCWRKRTL